MLKALLLLAACATWFRSAKDLSRRREDLRRLLNEHARLKGLDKAAVASVDRDNLLRAAGSSSTGLGRGGGAAESAATRDLTTQQLVDRTEAEIKTQDAVIDQMSEGLASLTNIGKAIGDETTLHLVRCVILRCQRWRAMRPLYHFHCALERDNGSAFTTCLLFVIARRNCSTNLRMKWTEETPTCRAKLIAPRQSRSKQRRAGFTLSSASCCSS
jgi:hypothetical protein